MLKAFTVTITPELKAFDNHAENYMTDGDKSYLDFEGFKKAVAELQAQAEPAGGECKGCRHNLTFKGKFECYHGNKEMHTCFEAPPYRNGGI